MRERERERERERKRRVREREMRLDAREQVMKERNNSKIEGTEERQEDSW